jgi:hypothetical protein
VGKVANGINTVRLSYVREGAGHALIGAREWVPAEHIDDPVRSQVMGLGSPRFGINVGAWHQDVVSLPPFRYLRHNVRMLLPYVINVVGSGLVVGAGCRTGRGMSWPAEEHVTQIEVTLITAGEVRHAFRRPGNGSAWLAELAAALQVRAHRQVEQQWRDRPPCRGSEAEVRHGLCAQAGPSRPEYAWGFLEWFRGSC